MTKRTLFVCEKPSVAEDLSVIMGESDKAILGLGAVIYKFNYQDVKFSESPYTKEEPKYKLSLDTLSGANHFHYGVWNNTKEKSDDINLKEYFELVKKNSFNKKTIECLFNFFNDFDEVVYACDNNATGCRSFCFKFEKYFNLGKNWINYFEDRNIKMTAMYIFLNDKTSLKKAYGERTPIKNSEYFQSLVDDYIKKDFFEYNYNLNSILFYSDALRKVGYIKDENYKVLTKNYILSLYLLQENENLLKDDFIDKMEERKIGTSRSRNLIIENLLKMNMIKDINDGNRISLMLSNLGKSFLNLLHKKVNDKYLGIRLSQDRFYNSNHIKKNLENTAQMSVEDFKSKYEKYLYNTFSKQKRFLRKIKRN